MMPPAQEKPAEIAIIGGGYSGMAAAIRVTELGGTATVFEAGPILGGRARRIEYAGRVLDNGQHILSGAYTELLRLMDVIGASAADCLRVPLTLSIPPNFALRAPLLPAPLHMALALLTARGLQWGDRIAAIRLMRALKKLDFTLPPEMTVASLMRQYRQPAELIKYLWQPLTVSALNTPIEIASAQIFANVLRDALAGEREASDLLLPKTDLSALFPEPAAAWVKRQGGNVMTGTRVSHIEQIGRKVRLLVKDAPREFDAAIVAVGPHQRAALNASAAWSNTVGAYEPIVTIYFGFETDESLPTPMLGQSDGIVQWFFDRRALAKSNAATELVIAAVISASGPHDKLTQSELSASALSELRRHIPTLLAPTWQKVVTEKFATFSCSTTAHRPAARTEYSRIWLAGDDVQNPARQYPATLEGAARNGVHAAELAIVGCRD